MRLSPHIDAWHAANFPTIVRPDPEPLALRLYVEGGLEGLGGFAFGLGDPVAGLIFGGIERREATALHLPAKVLRIDEIVVAPELRRQGAARALFAAALAQGREAGCDEAALSTYQGNAGAQAFFKAMGFAPRLASWTAVLTPPVP